MKDLQCNKFTTGVSKFFNNFSVKKNHLQLTRFEKLKQFFWMLVHV